MALRSCSHSRCSRPPACCVDSHGRGVVQRIAVDRGLLQPGEVSPDRRGRCVGCVSARGDRRTWRAAPHSRESIQSAELPYRMRSQESCLNSTPENGYSQGLGKYAFALLIRPLLSYLNPKIGAHCARTRRPPCHLTNGASRLSAICRASSVGCRHVGCSYTVTRRVRRGYGRA